MRRNFGSQFFVIRSRLRHILRIPEWDVLQYIPSTSRQSCNLKSYDSICIQQVMVRKRLYAFVRICFPSCQTTPVIEYKFNKKSRFFKQDNLCHSNSFWEIDCSPMVIFHQMVVSNETISEDMAFSFRNIEGHKHIDKRLYAIQSV